MLALLRTIAIRNVPDPDDRERAFHRTVACARNADRDSALDLAVLRNQIGSLDRCILIYRT